MRTLQVFRDWARSAEALADPEVSQHRIDGQGILLTILEESDEFDDHPVADMWRGYHSALAIYTIQHCVEWHMKRRNMDVVQFQIHPLFENSGGPYEFDFVQPPWRDDVDMMRSHRSNLVREDPKTYGKMFKGTPADMPYLWPVCYDDGTYDLTVSDEDRKLLKKGKRKLPKALMERIA